MCIILTCEKNVRPDHDLIETCFYNNPDGAGIMWVEDGRVQTAKGFASVYDLEDAINYVPMDSRLVIHMRIATSGGVDVGTCHPFPICDELDILHAQYTECDAAICHNGIISGVPTDDELGISDTVWYVSHIVNDLYNEQGASKSMRRKVKELAPGNRFAIMTKDGQVYRLGVGWESVCKGIQASNATWRYDKYIYTFNNRSYGSLYDYEDYDLDYFDPAEQEAMKFFCGDCKQMATCMMWGPTCDGIEDLVDEYLTYGPLRFDNEFDDEPVWAIA